jgi:hypothetical protein
MSKNKEISELKNPLLNCDNFLKQKISILNQIQTRNPPKIIHCITPTDI